MIFELPDLQSVTCFLL